MLQYLINLSGIWFLCLVVFDIFLKRESYHGYNRLYLNISILMGLLLPLLSWKGDSIIYASEYSKTVADQASIIKDQVVTNTNGSFLEWETWLWIAYATGAAISLLFLLKELFTIIKMIRTDKRSKSGVWTIIETNSYTSPFSAFRYVFVDNLDNYTPEELAIILAHEKQHGHLLHFIDLLFVNIVKVIFWFNPLIYVFEKRLLMVHEYQADQIIESQPEHYGQFLIEQSMLRTAPALSHSFIRSPLKNRIMMLTKRSGKLASGKKLFIIPIMLTATLCFTQLNSVFGQRVVDGNKITYNGNTFEKMVGETDTVMIQDPVTGEIQTMLTTREGPIYKVNGNNIIYQYYYHNAQPVEITKAKNKIKAAVSNTISDQLSQMQRMKDFQSTTFNYSIGQIVIDQNGRIIYYELLNLFAIKPSDDFNTSSKRVDIPKDLSTQIEQKIVNVLQDINADIMYQDGKATPYVLSVSDNFAIK